MRLFHSLSSNQKASAVKHCIDDLLRQILNGSLFIELEDEDSIELSEKINDAINHISTIELVEDKIAYIMDQQFIRIMLQELGTDLAHQTIYMDDEETVMYLNELEEPEKLLTTSTAIADDELVDDMADDEFFDLKNNEVKKNPYGLN